MAVPVKQGETYPQISRPRTSATFPGPFPLGAVMGTKVGAYLSESLLECAPRDLNPRPLPCQTIGASVAGTRYDEHQMRTLDSERQEAWLRNNNEGLFAGLRVWKKPRTGAWLQQAGSACQARLSLPKLRLPRHNINAASAQAAGQMRSE